MAINDQELLEKFQQAMSANLDKDQAIDFFANLNAGEYDRLLNVFTNNEFPEIKDETKNNNINVSKTTIHIKGTDNAKIYVKNNEKEGVTAGLIINAAGEILKPIIIAKGKTKKCLNKYKLNNDNIIGTYSNNGWINNGIMKVVLDLINIKTNNNKACLLLDQFNAHTSESTKEYAATKNIELIFIPCGPKIVFSKA